MPNTGPKHLNRPDQRGPLVFETRTLVTGTARTETRTASAPAQLGAGLVSVPEGSDLELDVRLEGVSDGVLVTATVTAPQAGECARCLDPFTSTMQVRFQELFGYRAGGEDEGDDAYLLDGDLLDLEPAVRDALVLELPLSPLCGDDCQGLCPECGIRLAEAGAGHRHEARNPVWAALRDLRVAKAAPRGQAPDETTVEGRAPDRSAAPGGVKER
jgi:uncharacterized protein